LAPIKCKFKHLKNEFKEKINTEKNEKLLNQIKFQTNKVFQTISIKNENNLKSNYNNKISRISAETIKTQKRNGVRVLLSKDYIENISKFIVSFLKYSEIEHNVSSLSTCIEELVGILLNLSNASQTINKSPNINSFINLIGTFDSIYKQAKNNELCTGSIDEFKKYILIFINDSNIGKGDSDEYFKRLFNIVKNHYSRIYFELLRSSNSYREYNFDKAGQIFGDLFHNLLNLKELNDDMTTWGNYNAIIVDKLNFQNDASLFKKRIIFCVNSFEKIIPDIFHFYNIKIKGSEVIPTVSDLMKSIFETNQLLQCFDGLSAIINDLG